MATKNVSASEVRAWGRTQEAFAGQAWLNDKARGVIPNAAVEAFTKANKGRKTYSPKVAEHVVIEVPGVVSVDKAGRKVTKTVSIPAPEARALIGAEGKRGRLAKGEVAMALSALNADAAADTFTKAV